MSTIDSGNHRPPSGRDLRRNGRLQIGRGHQTLTQQITNRIKERYGDRQTVSRYARCVIRSFVAWGVLNDSGTKGCYEKAATVAISDLDLAILMLEAALHATHGGQGTMGSLINNSAFFPFLLPIMTGDFVSQLSDRIDVGRYGLDDELLKLIGK